MRKNNLECYFCGTIKDPINIEAYINSVHKYILHECVECGVQYWTPFNNPGADWYEKDERYKDANNDPVNKPTPSHRRVISFLAPFKGRVFDIGCGTGNFLNWAKLNDWNVAGIDFDSNAINSAKTIFLLPNIELASLDEYVKKHKNENMKYDLITFFDVFEHIDNHHEFLSQVRSILKPNGYIAMSMPYRLGSRWLQPNDLPPRHLTRWEEKSLKNFLERSGFNVVYIKRLPATFFYIVMKLRFKYGSIFSLGLVNIMRRYQGVNLKITNSNQPKQDKETLKIVIIHTLAKLKDVIIFGIPALFIWLCFLLSSKRYTGLFVIAKKII